MRKVRKGCFQKKRGLRRLRKGEMKRKGYAAKESFCNFAGELEN